MFAVAMDHGDAGLEKVFAAEKNVAIIRAGVIFLNIGVFVFLLDRSMTIAWLAWTISVAAAVYAVGVLALRPWLVRPLLQSSVWTSISDGALITLWILATGGVDSPFYLLWYVSLLAIAFRYHYTTTILVSGIYAAVYLIELVLLNQLVANLADVVVRVAYIFFVGGLAALLGQEMFEQTRAKHGMREVAETARAIGSAQDLADAGARIVEAGMALTASDRGALYVVDADRSSLRCVHASGLTEAYVKAREKSFRESPSYRVFGDARFVTFGDAALDETSEVVRAAVMAEGVRSGAVLPLRLSGRTVAVLSLYRNEVRAYSAADLASTAALCDNAAGVLDNTRLHAAALANEQRFRSLAETAGDGILIVDHNGNVVFANKTGNRLFGMEGSSADGRKLESLFAADSRMALAAAIDRVMTVPPDDAPDTLELKARTQAGKNIPVEVSVGGWLEESGRRATIIVRDLSDRLRSEAERRQRAEHMQELERLRELDEFKTHFINTAAHELGTPMTPIRVQMHVLKKTLSGNVNAQQQKSLDMLDRNLERMIALLSDILEGARLQANQLGVEKEPMDLSHIVMEAVESFEESARAKGVRLSTVLEPNVTLMADPKRVTQVLFNLLSNALKFTPPGGSVEAKTEHVNDVAVTRIKDTGSGMDRGQLDGLFRPFSQVHDSTQSTESGTGLGLYICRGIVDLHGGRIWADSPGPGLGSVFSFSMPLAESHEGTAPPEAPAHAETVDEHDAT